MGSLKDLFPGYYYPAETEFRKLWDESLFVTDTSALLNAYEYSTSTRKQFLDVLKSVSTRLWIPYQVALEFQKNRVTVIAKQLARAHDTRDKIVAARKSIHTALEPLKHHPFIEKAKVQQQIDEVIAAFESRVHTGADDFQKLLRNDYIREQIDTLLDGRIGLASSDAELDEIYRKGKDRYDHKVPPGYMDKADKPEPDRYGDLVIWEQLIKKAESTHKPIILIIDDEKEDWFIKVQDRMVGPRFELVGEMLSRAGVMYYAYTVERFLQLSGEYLNKKVEPQAIEEAGDVRKTQRMAASAALTATQAIERVAGTNQLQRQLIDLQGIIASVEGSNALQNQLLRPSSYVLSFPASAALNYGLSASPSLNYVPPASAELNYDFSAWSALNPVLSTSTTPGQTDEGVVQVAEPRKQMVGPESSDSRPEKGESARESSEGQ